MHVDEPFLSSNFNEYFPSRVTSFIRSGNILEVNENGFESGVTVRPKVRGFLGKFSQLLRDVLGS